MNQPLNLVCDSYLDGFESLMYKIDKFHRRLCLTSANSRQAMRRLRKVRGREEVAAVKDIPAAKKQTEYPFPFIGITLVGGAKNGESSRGKGLFHVLAEEFVHSGPDEAGVVWLHIKIVQNNPASFLKQMPAQDKRRRMSRIFRIGTVSDAHQSDGLTTEFAKRSFHKAGCGGRGFIINAPGFEDEASGHALAVFHLPPKEQISIFGEAVPTDAYGRDHKPSHGNRPGFFGCPLAPAQPAIHFTADPIKIKILGVAVSSDFRCVSDPDIPVSVFKCFDNFGRKAVR